MSILAPQLFHGNSSRALRATSASSYTTQPQPIPGTASPTVPTSSKTSTHKDHEEDINNSNDSFTTPPRLGLGLRGRDFDGNEREEAESIGSAAESMSPTSSSSSPPSPNSTSTLSLQLQSLSLASSNNSHSSHESVSSDAPSSTPLLSSTSTSSQLLSLYEATLNKLFYLRSQEKILSSQAGQLLKALQNEESVISLLNTTLKRTRNQHKKLLGRITAPRWEVKHHYHMTCMEHSLGHRQPHVLDVAEMLPGHLRLYSIARCASLIKRQLTTSTSRAKAERNTAADQIKEGYRQLREVRAEMKELMRLVEAMNAKTHLLPSQAERSHLDRMIRHHRKQLASLSANAAATAAMKGVHMPIPFTNGRRPPPQFPFSSPSTSRSPVTSPTTFSASTSIRMKYLKSLNLAPKPYESIKGDAEASSKEERERVAEVYNNEWKTMMMLFHSLEMQKKKKDGDSKDEKENPHNQKNHNINATIQEITSPTSPTSPESANLTSRSPSSSSDEKDHQANPHMNLASSPSSDLKLVQSYRKRMGIVTLPQPSLYDYNDADSATGEEENSTTRFDPVSPLSPSFSPLSTSPSSPHINSPSLSPVQTPTSATTLTPTRYENGIDHSDSYTHSLADGSVSLAPFSLDQALTNTTPSIPVPVPTAAHKSQIPSLSSHSSIGLSTSAPAGTNNHSIRKYGRRR